MDEGENAPPEPSVPTRAEFDTLKDEVSALRDQLREQKEEMTSARPAPFAPPESQDQELKVLIACYAQEIHGYANMVEGAMTPLVASLNKLETRMALLQKKLPAAGGARSARPATTSQQAVRRGRAALVPSVAQPAPQPPESLGKVMQAQIAGHAAVESTAAADATSLEIDKYMHETGGRVRQGGEATDPAEVVDDDAEAALVAAAEATKAAAAEAAAATADYDDVEGRRFRVLQPHAREEEEGRRARTPRRASPPFAPVPPSRSPLGGAPLWEIAPDRSPPGRAGAGASPGRGRGAVGELSQPGEEASSPNPARRHGAADADASSGAPVLASVYSGQVGTSAQPMSTSQPGASAGTSHIKTSHTQRTALLYPAPGRQIHREVRHRPHTSQAERGSRAPPQLQAGSGAVRHTSHPQHGR